MGFESGSVGGNGDGRVPISFPTHQIRRPFSGIGSPLCGYFSPRNGLGASPFILRGGWMWECRGSAPSVAPVWGHVGGDDSCCCQVKDRLAGRGMCWAADKQVRWTLSAGKAITSNTEPAVLPGSPHRGVEIVGKSVFSPSSDYYGNVVGLNDCGYRAMPQVEQALASYLSPDAASSLKSPSLPSKPLRTSSVLVGKGYAAAGQAGACLHTMSVL